MRYTGLYQLLLQSANIYVHTLAIANNVTICFVVSGMHAAICWSRLEGQYCLGGVGNNAACRDDCMNHGYTGGFCNSFIKMCDCSKPCAAEQARNTGNPAHAGDMMSQKMEECS